eukprot:sb/3477892/
MVTNGDSSDHLRSFFMLEEHSYKVSSRYFKQNFDKHYYIRGTTYSCTILKFALPYVVPLILLFTSTDSTFGANFSTHCRMWCLLLINISGTISTQSHFGLNVFY